MAINSQGLTGFVRSQVAAIQAAVTEPLDVSVGSVTLALTQAVAGVALWLQGQILAVLTLTRAATSTGSDLDSWMADYGLSRLAAVPAQGQVTLSRLQPDSLGVVPVGIVVATASIPPLLFTVTGDPTNSAYGASAVPASATSPASPGYSAPAGIAGVTVPVVAQIAGSAGNVAAGAISLLQTPVMHFDTVSNIAALTGGLDAESDSALRSRFQLYIQSLSKATDAAIGYAVTSLRQGLAYGLVENLALDGSADPGSFYVVVDDGTGSPAASLVTAASAAIEAVRPAGVSFAVYPPSIIQASVTLTITTAVGYVHANSVLLVQAALISFINGLALGTALPYTRLVQVAYDTPGAGVINVSQLLLNGGVSDLAVSPVQVIKANNVTVI